MQPLDYPTLLKDWYIQQLSLGLTPLEIPFYTIIMLTLGLIKPVHGRYSSGKCKLPSTPTSTGFSRIQHLNTKIVKS
jgi:hypothetical protein